MDKITLTIILLLFSLPNLALKDPTRPLNMSTVKTKKVNNNTIVKQPLTAIFYKKNQYFAIIEDKKYKIGESYKGSKIVKITTNKVILRSSKGSHQLKLFHKIKK
ncbi:hypothetical protein [Aliikangiella sp. IMCC44359]|uniref:hypothetical protein n=1 Tax=Aliikangiella sp. IMCC44359 TaxID=3459125 RepID=UPI00403B1DB3